MTTSLNTSTDQIAALEKYEAALKLAKSDNAKQIFQSKISKIKQEIKDGKATGIDISAKELAGALIKSRKKFVEMSSKDFDGVIKRLSAKPEYAFLKNYTRNEIIDDIKRKAKPVGWRFKGRTNYRTPSKDDVSNRKSKGVYYEGRPKRSDVSYIKQLAKGGSIRRSNDSPVLKYVNFEDGWHINLKILKPFTNQDGNRYKGNNKYGISRQGGGQGQDIWEFETLNEAETKFNELVNLGKTYSKIRNQGEIEGNYAKGGSMASGGYVDLFEDYESQSEELSDIVNLYSEKYEDGEMSYSETKEFLSKVEAIGYTFDYGLDNMPYDLREKGSYAKGGSMASGAKTGFDAIKNKPVSFEVFDNSKKSILKTKNLNKASDKHTSLMGSKVIATDSKGNTKDVSKPKNDGHYAKGGEVRNTGNTGAAKWELKITDRDGTTSSVYANKKSDLTEYLKLNKDRLAHGGKVTSKDNEKQTTRDFNLGEIVYDTNNKGYGIIIDIYDDYPYELRLDSDGMQPTEDLRKLNSSGDKGTKNQLIDAVNSYSRLINAYPDNNYPPLIFAEGGSINEAPVIRYYFEDEEYEFANGGTLANTQMSNIDNYRGQLLLHSLRKGDLTFDKASSPLAFEFAQEQAEIMSEFEEIGTSDFAHFYRNFLNNFN